MKIEAKTIYSKRERSFSEPGSEWKELYEHQVNPKNGAKRLVCTGKENLFEKIQSHAEECKIENILKQVAIGDMSAFRPQGIYEDISEYPKDLLSAQMAMQKCENDWMKLPAETREKFNNDLSQYIASAGSAAWMEKIGYTQGKEAPTIEAEETTVPVPEPTEAKPAEKL